MKFADKQIGKPAGVIEEAFDDWTVLFDPREGDAVGVNPAGVEVWKLIDGRRTLRRIIAAMSARYPDASDAVGREVTLFIDDMVGRGWAHREPNGDGGGAAGRPAALRERAAPVVKSRIVPPPSPGINRGKGARVPRSGGEGGLLVLADGSRWVILGEDPGASSVVSRFSDVMRLPSPAAAPSAPGASRAPGSSRVGPRRVLVSGDGSDGSNVVDDAGRDAVRALGHVKRINADRYPRKYMRLSAAIAHEIQIHGGMFLHGALASLPPPSSPRGARDARERGVILAGPHDVGKTTASERLPPPWRSLCDDASLVVRDREGAYWAHPWPTWTRFLDGGPGGVWDVQRAVPLRAIFFLNQAPKDRLEPVGAGRAASMLAASTKEISWLPPPNMEEGEKIAFHRARFENLCALARTAPAYMLHLGPAGDFWRKMERVLER
ncbi:MAG: SynChlorMet cassette protein ScmC [Desulfobacterales bacterium]|nr:SynChlorMet cassette protein ScmC [Desulfobacterales bacterium]